MNSSRFSSIVLLAATVTGAQAQLFQPTSAIAGSEFSATYEIENAIDGSGLPVAFTAASAHAAYSATNGGNHWTTRSGAINAGTAWAEFSFAAPVTIGTFYMWNHQSNGGIADNPDYDVTRFNLRLYNSSNAELFSLLNASAQEDVQIAQAYAFNSVTDVSKVRFEILANARPNNDRYTGLGEVAFAAVPEPGTLAVMGLGAFFLRRRRQGIRS